MEITVAKCVSLSHEDAELIETLRKEKGLRTFSGSLAYILHEYRKGHVLRHSTVEVDDVIAGSPELEVVSVALDMTKPIITRNADYVDADGNKIEGLD